MKKIYHVEVEEILQRVVDVEAESYDDAEDIVRDKYHDCNIVLDYNDLKETNFRQYEDKIKDKNYER